MRVKITDTDALIIVDMQNDFMPGGALPVPEGDRIVPVLNRYIEKFSSNGNPVFFTRDWHPEDHISFKGYGGIWPPHCVQGTKGAEFHPELKIPYDNKFIISKGYSRDFDAYSGFQGTILDNLLKERGVKRIFVGGVATDYCVKNTALGGLNLGYQVFILEDGIKGVNVNPEDSKKALNLLLERGAVLINLEDIEQ
ncbi:nicotinamidase/pyrazinamidase [Persephonella hydrogeniphila]|uniref:nicotinamidase n=1 Tax=Persephonella hydrogeniphila TaxID=198703 RepID=A0A285NMB9_9AQUI|nr:nicotinamidase [Persephonella hydrogeniphila]SNZ10378.1 nicotinamidase/pyrazinamidase [Persephonella hydrogeniphila]